MILEGFFSGLEAQSEITDLLDILHGSYGERLIATYKIAAEGGFGAIGPGLSESPRGTFLGDWMIREEVAGVI